MTKEQVEILEDAVSDVENHVLHAIGKRCIWVDEEMSKKILGLCHYFHVTVDDVKPKCE